MTKEQIKKAKKCIDSMSQYEMAKLRRFAPSGHPYFDKRNIEIVKYFDKKLKELGE